MRKISKFATAADTFDIESLVRELDRDGANSRVRQGHMNLRAANDRGIGRRLSAAA